MNYKKNIAGKASETSMRKIIICVCLLMAGLNIMYAFHYYPNPGWHQGSDYIGWNGSAWRLARPRFTFEGAFVPDYADGIYEGLYYQAAVDIRISRMINSSLHIRLGNTVPTLDALTFNYSIKPVQFVSLSLGYQLRPLFKYSINEHNLIMLAHLHLDFEKMARWFEFHASIGFVLRYIDYDTSSNSLDNLISEYFMIWNFRFQFHPHNIYSIALEIGNYSTYITQTINWWQVMVWQDFHLPAGISLFINAGFAMAGSLPFAGIVYRGFGEIGVRYALQL